MLDFEIKIIFFNKLKLEKISLEILISFPFLMVKTVSEEQLEKQFFPISMNSEDNSTVSRFSKYLKQEWSNFYVDDVARLIIFKL